jgi:excisionase family DNA binding protein
LAALRQHFATRLLPEIAPLRTAASSLLTVKEAAAVLRVCTATVYAMIERGELPHVRVSNSIRIVLA